ncbi:MAG: NAD(P)-dependent oxidoreductase [Bdellovibrionales bacterium]|nr:NAD(P)-dependent oxidoreductase [Bdellovibrionales bacterium]
MPKQNTTRSPVVVTGSSGLIGSKICSSLSRSYTVVAIDVKEPEDLPDNVLWYKCDLTDDDSVRGTFERIDEQFGKRIISVVHLAAFYDFSGEPNDLYCKLTVEGTRRVLQNLSSFQVEQFIFSSSLLVMDPVDSYEEKLTEQSDVNAEWDYPESKLRAEKVIREEPGEIPTVILRIAGVYTNNCQSLPISQHIRRIYEKDFESYFFPGDPDHGQPFIHLDDVVSCINHTIAKRKELSAQELFLIAEPDVMSHEELQDKIGKLLHGKEWPTIRIPKTVAKAGAWLKEKLIDEDQFIKPWMIPLADDHYPVEISAAINKLNWEPKHRLRETLPRIIKLLKDDPKRWYKLQNLQWDKADHSDSAAA